MNIAEVHHSFANIFGKTIISYNGFKMNYNPFVWTILDCMCTEILDYNENIIHFIVQSCNKFGL